VVASGNEFPFTDLRRHQLREREPKIRSRPPQLIVRPSGACVDQRRGGANLKTALPADRQRLSDSCQVFSRASHRFAVDREPRVRPATGSDHIGFSNINDRSARSHARTLSR